MIDGGLKGLIAGLHRTSNSGILHLVGESRLQESFQMWTAAIDDCVLSFTKKYRFSPTPFPNVKCKIEDRVSIALCQKVQTHFWQKLVESKNYASGPLCTSSPSEHEPM